MRLGRCTVQLQMQETDPHAVQMHFCFHQSLPANRSSAYFLFLGVTIFSDTEIMLLCSEIKRQSEKKDASFYLGCTYGDVAVKKRFVVQNFSDVLCAAHNKKGAA